MSKGKRVLLVLLIFALALSLAGCTASNQTEMPDLDSILAVPKDEFDTFDWPDSEIAKLLPTPKSNYGKVEWEASYGFVIYVGETSKADYKEYVKSCKEHGFTLDVNSGDEYYYANNAEGYHLHLTYEGEDTMFVRIDDPDENSTVPGDKDGQSSENQEPNATDTHSTAPSEDKPGEDTPPEGSDQPELPAADDDTKPTEPQHQDEPTTPEHPPENSTFEIHFIDVGQADAALVLCDGEAMLVDGGNAEDSNLIYAYLKKLSLNHLKYIVCTHPHEDHVGGLAGALNYATVEHALCSVTSYDTQAFKNFVKYLNKQNVYIEIPDAGDKFTLGSAEVQVLGPVSESDEPNNMSIVLRIVYGETSFLFTGDAEREEEQDILNAGYSLESTVLKVGHHGSANSTTYPFLREIMPEYAVISVGSGNSYGHPTEEALSRLRDADVTVLRTDMQGDIICKSDGNKVSFTVERNADADTLAPAGPNSTQQEPPQETIPPETEPPETTPPETTPPETTPPTKPEQTTPAPSGTQYVLNTNTHKFHYPSCSSVKQMSEKNKWYYTGTRDEVIAMGYEPCKRCHP